MTLPCIIFTKVDFTEGLMEDDYKHLMITDRKIFRQLNNFKPGHQVDKTKIQRWLQRWIIGGGQLGNQEARKL